MKTLFVITFVAGFSISVCAGYLDDWTNDELCGWTDSASIPEHIQKEVYKREIICYGGKEVYELPSQKSMDGKYGTTFPSPDPGLIEELHSKHSLGPKSKMGGY